jgi:hypothetical protein
VKLDRTINWLINESPWLLRVPAMGVLGTIALILFVLAWAIMILGNLTLPATQARRVRLYFYRHYHGAELGEYYCP